MINKDRLAYREAFKYLTETEQEPEFVDLILQLMISQKMITAIHPDSPAYDLYLQASHDISVLLLTHYPQELEAYETARRMGSPSGQAQA